ncbi:MAG TPA: Mpo1-like protein, partial [Polyangiaceae bacterium]|nr:Mpo1-like protein [Polyangiaceae bacterium]
GGWALQYIGHYAFEGNKPAFYGDPYYLLVGPVWVAAEWMALVGIPVPEAIRPAEDVPAPVINGAAISAMN